MMLENRATQAPRGQGRRGLEIARVRAVSPGTCFDAAYKTIVNAAL